MGKVPQSGSLSERGKEAEQQSLICSNLEKITGHMLPIP